MSENFIKYDKTRFESELIRIAGLNDLEVGDYNKRIGKHNAEEYVYEITTCNPRVRILVYSSISPFDNQSRDIGGDAVRINFYCKYNGKYNYKKFKKHQRINTLFINLEKSIKAANEFVLSEDIKKWIYAITKN